MKTTAEEFFRNKIKELNPNQEVITLSRELINGEQGLRWAHEFKELHTKELKDEIERLKGENQWIKIEKEEDMPEENDNYFTKSETSYQPFYRVDIFCGRLRNSFTNGKSCFSHYQKITKPKPPIK